MSGEPTPRSGPGADHVGPIAICVSALIFVAISVALIYAIVQFWPPLADSTEGSQDPPVRFLGWTFALDGEVRLFVIVSLAGALGSMIHSLRSFAWYVGHRDLRWSWLAHYVMLPFGGAALGVIFYLVFRAGFFTPQASFEDGQISPFGFAALAALIGMFSDQAVVKLQEVAETVLAKPPGGADSVDPGNQG